MTFRWTILVALGIAFGVAGARQASAQVSAYAEFSASKLTGGLTTQTTNVLYGPTIGLTAQVYSGKHLRGYGDVRGEFYGSSQRLDGAAIGPKLGLPFRKFEAYGEILVGFARYNDGLGTKSSGSTDAQLLANFGLDRMVSPRFDWRVFEFGYKQFYGLGGEFNPKTFSTGVVFHLGGR